MPLYTKKDFAEKCGMPTNSLATYIRRKKVIVGDDDMINDKVSENRIFLAKHGGKQSEKQLVEEFKKRVPLLPATDDSPIDEQFKVAMAGVSKEDKPPMDLAESIEWEKYWSARKREKENEKLELDNQKKRGEVIPTPLLSPLFMMHNQSLMTSFKNGMEEVVRMMGKKYGMTTADMAEMRGQIIKIVNSSMDKATEATKAGIKGIVTEHQEKRGVGERQ